MSTDVDPNVKVPAAVRAAAARSEEAFKSVYAPPESNPEEPQTDATPSPEEAQSEQVTSEVTGPDNPPEAPPPAAPAAPPPSEQEWENRYKSMRGRFEKAEARAQRAEEQLAAALDRLSSMEELIASMKAQPAQPEPQPEELTITPEEEELYGPELLSIIAKRAKQEAAPLHERIRQLEAQLKNVGTTVKMSARDRLFETLSQRLSNWREINENPDFLSWLQLPDRLSGVKRHTLLKDAFEQHDAPRVIAFFEGFLAEEAAKSPAIADPSPAPVAAPKVPLEVFAAPGRAKTAAASAPAEKPVFTRAQIAGFYADVAAGKYRGREAEKDRLEQQIVEAGREGRIR